MIRLVCINELYQLLWEEYGPQHWWPAQSNFEIMVGAVLTQNTAWRNVEHALTNLKQARVLTPERILATPQHELSELLRPSGCYNVKAHRLRALCQWLVDNGGHAYLNCRSTRELRDALLSVHGVGEETADAIILYAFERPVFVVDAYTKRLLSRVGLIQGKEKYLTLQSLVAEQLGPNTVDFNEFHALIVEHVKRSCQKVPHCRECQIRHRCSYPVKTTQA